MNFETENIEFKAQFHTLQPICRTRHFYLKLA